MMPRGALTQALVTAFDMERQVQFQQSPAAWFGSGDESGFTCEVPYGPGPFPLGVIGMQSAVPHLSGPRTATSLVQGMPTDNPWLGNGLVFAVTSGGNDSNLPLPEWGAAALLNAQNRLRSDDASPGFAHAVGSWVKRNSNMTHVCFIPAGWDRLLTEEELIRFFRILLANAARLSWGSRQVLEPNRDRPTHDPTHPRMLAGLAAGANARGPQFGEPGSGINPGARALTFIWDKLVGSDDEFARVFDDVAGFRFWMGPAVLDITSHRCTCPSESGSLIVLESDLGNDTPEDRERLMRLQETGLPFAVVTTSGRLTALAQIHVHDDTLSFGAYWAVPLAVAMVLLADELSPPDARGIDLRLPGGEERTSRDGMLGTLGSHGLWASETPFGAGKSETRSPLTLLHAQLLVDSPGWRVADREGTLSVSRKYPVGRGEDWEAKSLDTACHYMTHPIYGTCLRLETTIPALGDVDAWRITGEFARDSFTLLGGFTPDAEGIRLVTLYPTAIDSSRTHAGEVSFAGTAMQHHALIIRMALNWFDALVGHDVDPDQAAAGVTDLTEAYRTTAGLPEQLQIGAGTWHGEVAVQWMRPWPYTGADTSPRLASDIEIDGEPWLAGQVTLDLATVGSFTERILHAVLALSAPLPEPISGPGPLLGELIPMLGPAECENIYARATAYFDIRKDEDDRYVILSEDDRVIAQFVVETRDDHQAWGTSLDVVARMLVPADTDYGDPRLVHPWVIGAWSERDDMLEFRISLPPAVLAGRDSQSILAEVVVCAAPVIAHARAAARRLE